MYHNYGLYSSQGIVDSEHPTIIISNETVHPIHLSVDMRLGSVVPYIRITDNFFLAKDPPPTLPSEIGSSDDSSFSTLLSAGTTACASVGYSTFRTATNQDTPSEPNPPDPPQEYGQSNHIPGTFSIDMSPAATTDPADALLPKIDKNLSEVWQQRFRDLSKEFYKIFIKDFSGDPWC